MDTYILGISAFYHDSAACLVRNGEIVSAAQEERFSRVKNDPSFPNHHPDPTVDHNLADLVKEIKSGKYDFGIAYDGDADRVICIDSNGKIIRSDILMCIFIEDILRNISRHAYKSAICDNTCGIIACDSTISTCTRSASAVPQFWALNRLRRCRR